MKRLAALFLVLMALAAGCDTASDEDGEPVLDEIPSSVDLRTFALPLDAYERSDMQHVLTAKAMAVLSTRCLTRFGFDIATPATPEAQKVGHLYRYGIVAMEDAQRYGYHPARGGDGGKPQEPRLSPEAFAVMHGDVAQSGQRPVPQGGCLGEARRLLAMRDDSAEATVYRLGGEASKLAEKDSRVQAVFAAWSKCMAAEGYQYRDPWQANDDPRWKQAATATTEEVAVAVADVRCKRQAHVVEVWATVEAAYQRRAMEQNVVALHEAKTALEIEARNVSDALAGVK